MTRDVTNPFEYAEGAEFVRELINSSDLQSLADALYTVPDEETEYVVRGTATRALIAAEVLLTQQGNESGDVPDDLYSWLRDFGEPDPDLLRRALRAVQRVGRDSELAELWSDSVHYREWRQRIDSLLKRLS